MLSFSSARVIRGANYSEYTSVLLCTVYLWSDLISGQVNVGVRSLLPFEGVQLLLRNNSTGDCVVIHFTLC